MSYKKGDYVLCNYEGKEYTGLVLETPKKDVVNLQINTSSKRADKPILETILLNICDIRPIKIN